MELFYEAENIIRDEEASDEDVVPVYSALTGMELPKSQAALHLSGPITAMFPGQLGRACQRLFKGRWPNRFMPPEGAGSAVWTAGLPPDSVATVDQIQGSERAL